MGCENDENDGMKENVEWPVDNIPHQTTEAFTETKDMEGDNEYLSNDTEVQTWFHKVKLFLEHMNTVAECLFDKLSDFLSLDGMMKLFKGRSSQTHMMKNKPIKNGFKFCVISCLVSGFVYQIVTCGRLENNKIYAVANNMVDELLGMDTRENTGNTKYVLPLDNHFTLARAIGERGLHGKGVGVVGTARARPGWPCPKFEHVTDD